MSLEYFSTYTSNRCQLSHRQFQDHFLEASFPKAFISSQPVFSIYENEILLGVRQEKGVYYLILGRQFCTLISSVFRFVQCI